MGKLRTDSTEDFPVESRSGGIGYILIYNEPAVKERTKTDEDGRTIWIDKENLEYETEEYQVFWQHYKATKTEKTSLLNDLKEVDDFETVDLLGVWTGRHRTDVHHLDLPRFLDRMEQADL